MNDYVTSVVGECSHNTWLHEWNISDLTPLIASNAGTFPLGTARVPFSPPRSSKAINVVTIYCQWQISIDKKKASSAAAHGKHSEHCITILDFNSAVGYTNH